MFAELPQDFRLAWRRLRSAPSFTTVAILSLTLGIGANTAIYTLLNGLILRAPAVRSPNELVQLSVVMRNGPQIGLSFPAFRQIERDSTDVFSSLIAWTSGLRLADVNGEPFQANVWMVTGNFHSELAAQPAVGRLLTPSDVGLEALSGETVAVLGFEFWQRRFGGDLAVVGRTVHIEGAPFTIVGVAPRGFRGVSRIVEPELTVPLTSGLLGVSSDQAQFKQGNVFWINAVGRRKPGVTFDQARAKLMTGWPHVLATTMPANFSEVRRANFMAIRLVVDSVVEPGERLLRRQFERPLLIVMGIALFVLLIACVNLASLMLARTMKRGHEIAVQLALGATRWRSARQVLAEGLILSLVGGVCGVAAAPHFSDFLAKLVLSNRLGTIVSMDTTPDVRILGVTSALVIATALLFSAIPAWVATGRESLGSLQRGGRTVSNSSRLARGLVATQIALCLVLLIDAGLLLRTLTQLRNMSPGFVANGVSAAALSPRLGGTRGTDNDRAYVPALLTAVTSRPGIQSASTSWFVPGSGEAPTEFVAPSVPGSDEIASAYDAVSPGFFHLLEIPLLEGRDFTGNDDAQAQAVAIVSRALAKQLFPDRDPIGQHIRIGVFPHRQHVQVVGVVGDTRLHDIKNPNTFAAYMPYAQDPRGYGTTLLLRGAAISGADLARTVASLGHDYVSTFDPLDGVRDRALVQERVAALLGEFFGGLSLLLAAIGVYGLMSYDVGERTRELGIRLALGATPHRVLTAVVRRASVTIVTGIVLGLGGGWAGTKFVQSLLYGVTQHDGLTLTAASLVLASVATLACLVPARRAARVDVIEALRHE